MKNYDLAVKAFADALGVDPGVVGDDLAYTTNSKWDSTAHMELISLLEETFNVSFEMDDIIDMSSFSKAISILKKYGVAM
jgi:acyl carrier protein